MAEPRLWLIEPPSKDGLPDFKRYDKVYARFVLLRRTSRSRRLRPSCCRPTWNASSSRCTERCRSRSRTHGKRRWPKARRSWRAKQDKQQLDAMDVAINDPDQSPLEQQNHQLEEDDPEAAKKIQAQTRDSDPSIRLIVIYRIGERDYLDPGGVEPFDESKEPDLPRVRRLLDNEVSISHRGCFAFYAGRSVPKGWQRKACATSPAGPSRWGWHFTSRRFFPADGS